MTHHRREFSRGFGNAAIALILATLAVPVVMFAVGISFWFLSMANKEQASVPEPAPEGGFELRRQWGEETLGVYLSSAEAFVKRNEKIKDDIGNVLGVAPVGRPNRHGSSFGESWTKLNLQVIGSSGEGVLTVSEFNWGGRTGQPKWEEKHWSYRQF